MSGNVYSQIAIGKESVSSPSVSLDFGLGNRGIILPWVTSEGSVTGVVNGTLVYDLNDKKVKVKYASGWKDLTVNTNGTTVQGGVDGALIQASSVAENTSAKTAIGTTLSSAPGILVLEDTDKAMVLPTAASPHLNIINPAPGMMVYDNFNKVLAVYNGTVWSFWRGGIEAVPTVTTGTGRVWMDRNLGATQVATSSTDALAYGSLYQWGRLSDGHQLRTSPNSVLNATSSTDVPGNGNFIIVTTGQLDWRNPQNNNLWEGVNGINNPCPSGFRIPTTAEFQAEIALLATQNASGAYNSPLKLTVAGYRQYNNGSLQQVGGTGYYYTSSESGTNTTFFYFNSSAAGSVVQRAYGMSVRCIKN
ncbi:FISUMP domain-containing protein [Chryseobacterium sp. 3008163]|uniref:FISUMP domain-containing protein n=1 Tax=Chryseobacterium sp. 3008163 TaxID=2478663 RepID=UPI001625CF7C|nr:FISUMP domain-containing protein [Chryseobacterium sp. 3008163]